MGMGFPMGMGIPWDSHGIPMVMGIGDKIGNGNGKEWETTCMGMGMAIIPMGWESIPIGGYSVKLM